MFEKNVLKVLRFLPVSVLDWWLLPRIIDHCSARTSHSLNNYKNNTSQADAQYFAKRDDLWKKPCWDLVPYFI